MSEVNTGSGMRDRHLRSLSTIGFVAAVAALIAVGCTAEAERGMEAPYDDYWGGDGEYTTVSDPIEFTDEPYDFTGDTPIGELRELIPDQDDEAVWHAFSSDEPYPVQDDCNPEFGGAEQAPASLDELPATIEGVVTLHPRYFENSTFCGSRERYYGTYTLQDASGGIHVLRNSRIGEFDVGDRVRIRVRAITREFSMEAVLTFDEQEVLTDRDSREAIYFEEIGREFDEDEDLYQVRRITGEVVTEATNQNFNEMVVQPQDDPDVEWLVSLDRELGTRGVGPKEGDIVELTGPVVDSFGLRMLIASLGKIEILEAAN